MKGRVLIVTSMLVLVLVLLGFVIQCVVKDVLSGAATAPEISAPFSDDEFSSEEFNSCFKSSKSVYEVSKCYTDRVQELVSDKSKNIHLPELYILIPRDDTAIDKYIVYSDEYEKGLDTSFFYERYITFEYPSNKVINQGIYDYKLFKNMEEAKEEYSRRIEEYNNANNQCTQDLYIFPLSNSKADYYLKLLKFKSNDSQIFLKEVESFCNK